MKNIIVLIGKRCAGKNAVAWYLNNHFGFNKIPSCTTRELELGEIDGKDYYCKTEEEFNKLKKEGKLFEYSVRERNGKTEYYGTLKEEFNNNNKAVIALDVKGAKYFKSAFPDKVAVVYVKCSKEVRYYRATLCEDWSENDWENNYNEEKKEFEDATPCIDYVVHNEVSFVDELTEVVNKICS